MSIAYETVKDDYVPTPEDWDEFGRWLSGGLPPASPAVIPLPVPDAHERAVSRLVRLTNGSRTEVQAIVSDLAEAIGRQIVAELQHEGLLPR